MRALGSALDRGQRIDVPALKVKLVRTLDVIRERVERLRPW